MAYTDIDKPSDYFETVLYTGNGGTQSITGVGFQPDWVWIKGRSVAYSHILHDVVRGSTKELKSNSTGAEGTDANGLTSFDSDGFSLGTGGAVNNNGTTYASWNWKAGTSFTNDASATGVGSIDSTGSVNTDAGFSIISYTGTGSAGTVAHGLSAVPKMIIVKNRDGTQGWGVYHASLGNTKFLQLNATAAEGTASTFWNNTTPTSSVFSIGTSGWMNDSSNEYIAYCFADVKGYSKFGSYTGNGSSDGVFCFTGMKPSFILTKANASGYNWLIYDTARNTYNAIGKGLFPDASNVEYDYGNVIDCVSNGFKFRSTVTNETGKEYIYMAFAENPFVTSTGVPATAR